VSSRHLTITKLTSSPNTQADDARPFWLLFDESSTCIAELDLQLQVIGGNAGFAQAFGLNAGKLPRARFVDLVHSSARARISWQLRGLVLGERSRFTERVLAHRGSSTPNLKITGISVVNDAGLVESLIVLVQPDEPPAHQEAAAPAVPLHAKVRKPLTKMDAGVLEGVASGMSTVKLATDLFLSCGGVEYHVSALMKRLKAGNRSELVSKAYAAGLLSVGVWPPRVAAEFVE
jgi:DNA-binding CsgD family transcriptional regulator